MRLWVCDTMMVIHPASRMPVRDVYTPIRHLVLAQCWTDAGHHWRPSIKQAAHVYCGMVCMVIGDYMILHSTL